MEKKLFEAIAAGNTSEALTLLDDVNVRGWINKVVCLESTCLYWACRHNNKAVVSKLLTVPGVDINKAGVLGTPLSAATQNKNNQFIELLVSHGARCEGNIYNVSPLHIAAEQDDTDTLECLLKHFSTNINQQTTQSLFTTFTPLGSTPLHFAAYHGNIKPAKIILKYGGDITIKTDGGQTAYDIAVDRKHEDIAKYLKEVAAGNASTTTTTADLVSRVNKLEIKCEQLQAHNNQLQSQVQSQSNDHQSLVRQQQSQIGQVQSQCNALKAESDTLKTRVCNLEDVKMKTSNTSKTHKNEGKRMAKCVKKSFKYLTENLDTSDHLDFLYQEDSLTREDYQVIRSKAADVEKTREMLIRLLGKSNDDWVWVLQESMQKNAKHLLKIFN